MPTRINRRGRGSGMSEAHEEWTLIYPIPFVQCPPPTGWMSIYPSTRI